MKQTERYNPGYASLAMAVLKEAKEAGQSNEQLAKSIWAQYLLWSVKQQHKAIKEGFMV